MHKITRLQKYQGNASEADCPTSLRLCRRLAQRRLHMALDTYPTQNPFEKMVTFSRPTVQTGESRQREEKWFGQDHAADEWQRSDFSDTQNAPLPKPLAVGEATTQLAGQQQLCGAEDQLCSFVATGQTYQRSHRLLHVTSGICRSQSLSKAGHPQWRLSMRQTFLNCATQTTSDNWQVLTTLYSRSSQNTRLFYCDLQHLRDPPHLLTSTRPTKNHFKTRNTRLVKVVNKWG